MPTYDKGYLSSKAKELSFVRDTFEKVLRLSETLDFLNKDPLLKKSLALKGGTAINLTIFDLPRLSVDIDLDYTVNESKEEMLEKRKIVSEKIKKYMFSEKYELSSKSKSYHSLDSFVFTYTNSAGIKDNIKIEINYSLRAHILPIIQKQIYTKNAFNAVNINVLSPEEIFATKVIALLTRAAARDLYDMNNLISYNIFGDKEINLLKKCMIFYSVVSCDTKLEDLSLKTIDNITKYKIRTDLNPVIRKKEVFNLELAKENVKSFIGKLLDLSEDEKSFLSNFYEGNYTPNLLFEDKEILSRITEHPMIKWKTRAILFKNSGVKA